MNLPLRVVPLHIRNIKFWLSPLTLKHKNIYTNLNILENNLTSVYCFFIGIPGGAVVKNLPANAGDSGSIPGLGSILMNRCVFFLSETFFNGYKVSRAKKKKKGRIWQSI